MSYNQAIKKSLPALICGRLIPTLGISAIFLLMAHKSPADLAVFAYVLAVTNVISVPFSLILATMGNKAAALTHNSRAQRDLFTGGFTLALLIGILACLGCLSITYFISETAGIQHVDKQAFCTLALIYTACSPLLVINTYLSLFLEATGKASDCANGRTVITLLCVALLAILAVITSGAEFTYWAMLYFFATELLTLLFLLRLSRAQRYWCLPGARKISSYFSRTGIPVAAGLGGQKIYFYLLTERLVRIDDSLVAQLSIFMTTFGLLIIPSVALSQLHSLQVSQHPACTKEYFRAGLIWVTGLMTLSAVILYAVAQPLFMVIGGPVIVYSDKLYFALILFLGSSALLSLALAHLRAWHETFTPQLLINTIMLAVLTPALYALHFNQPTLATFLLLQSAAVFAGFLLLCARIFFLHRHR